MSTPTNEARSRLQTQSPAEGTTTDWTDEQIDAVWGRYDQGYDTRRALIGRILAAAQAPAPAPDVPAGRKLAAFPVDWTPGGDWFKAWAASWFGPDADDQYLRRAVQELLTSAPAAQAPAVGAEDEREPLSLAVVDAARAAMDESVEAFTDRMDIIIPAHLASALSLRLDEYDRAHGIGEPKPPVQGTGS